jgi:hypothetical protein
MNDAGTLDDQIRKAAFWSVIATLLAGVISLFLPLDAPDGSFAERVTWLHANRSVFIASWIVQMITMLTLSAAFAGVTWELSHGRPLRAIVAGVVVLLSIVSFIIPKFIAIWSIPLLAEAIATDSAGADMAQRFLPLLGISHPYTLSSSFDYLGFWLYAVFSLLVARPLFQLTLSAKIASLGFGAFGVMFHALLAGALFGAIALEEIGGYADAIGSVLSIAVVALAFFFKGSAPSSSH